MRPIHLLMVGLFALATDLLVPTSAQESKPQAPGKMVDIGGYQLYLDCRGKGSPTVVLDSGLDDTSGAW
jgi:hypothetical protein